jgi:hypothetical protein
MNMPREPAEFFLPELNLHGVPRIVGQTVTNAFNPKTLLNDRTEVLQAYPNNVRDIFRNGMNWQNNIAFSGGSDKNTFRFSYGLPEKQRGVGE